MNRRFARPNPFNPFTIPGLLFNAPEGDDGGAGGSDAAAQAAAAEAAAKAAADEAAAKKAGGDEDKTDWKTESRKWEKQSKDNSAAAKELAALKAKDQTDAERVTAERDTANAKVKTATRRAVTSEVKSVAAGLKFTDPTDAVQMLNLDDLTDDDGEILDADLLAALKSIAKNKPYLLTTSGAGRSAVDHGAGGSGEGGSNRPKSIGEALTRANAQ